MLKLAFYQDNETDRARIASYQLSSNPEFTATPEQALAQAKDDADRHPVLILEDGKMVGFFVLVTGTGVDEVHADRQKAVLIRSLSVAENARGRGVATRAFKMLPEFVHEQWPAVRELTLSVDHGNSVAQGLYKKLGYTDTGKRGFGRYGTQYVLTYPLNY